MNEDKKKLFKNHFIRWGITIPASLGFISIVSVLLMQTGFFRNEAISDAIAILFIVITTVVATNYLIKFLGHRLNSKYMEKFKLYESTLSFEETKQMINIQPYNEHLVLMFHGFTASTQEFKYLKKFFDEHNIAYYAPKITGFGIANTKLLSGAEAEDWFRIALESYDLASQISKKISIVGHSMGCILGTYIAKHRPVHNLILSAPGLYSSKSDLTYKKLLLTPFISTIFRTLIPMLPKPMRKNRISTSDTLDISVVSDLFQYIAIPIFSVMQIFRAQNLVNINQAQADNIIVLCGKHDLTVDVDVLFEAMDKANMDYKKIIYENSAHNLLEDFERELVCDFIVKTLLKPG